jgi:hypothetical protein
MATNAFSRYKEVVSRFSPQTKRMIALAVAGYLLVGTVLSMVAPSVGNPMLGIAFAAAILAALAAAIGII